MTSAEKLLWTEIRCKRLGYRVHRQTPIAGYIVDFYCPKAQLVIEIDGPYHAGQQQQDEIRQRNIEALGFTFLRFTNSEIFNSLPEVLRKIRRTVASKYSTDRT